MKYSQVFWYEHSSLMVTAAGLGSDIYTSSMVHGILSSVFLSETELLLMVILKRNVVMMQTGVKIMHQDMRDTRSNAE